MAATGNRIARIRTQFAVVTVGGTPVEPGNQQRPTITRQPVSVTTIQGGLATMSIDAGTQASYQWFVNTTNSTTGGRPIEGMTSKAFFAPTLALGRLYYYVVVSYAPNNYTISNIVSVEVRPGVSHNAQHPTINRGLQPVTVNVGQTATLSVDAQVTDGGNLSYEWFINSQPSMSRARFVAYTRTSELTVDTSRAGVFYYVCIVRNNNRNVIGNRTAIVLTNFVRVTVQ